MNRAICLALALAAMFAIPKASTEPKRGQYELLELCAGLAMVNDQNRDSAAREMLEKDIINKYRAMMEEQSRDSATQEMLDIDIIISIKYKCFGWNRWGCRCANLKNAIST
jgi:hypothetical protein